MCITKIHMQIYCRRGIQNTINVVNYYHLILCNKWARGEVTTIHSWSFPWAVKCFITQQPVVATAHVSVVQLASHPTSNYKQVSLWPTTKLIWAV